MNRQEQNSETSRQIAKRIEELQKESQNMQSAEDQLHNLLARFNLVGEQIEAHKREGNWPSDQCSDQNAN